MATNFRIIHIGAGQTTVSGGDTYATFADYYADIGVGLPSDISSTGADEDWLCLFYGDGVDTLKVSGRSIISNVLITDNTNIITYRPAIGHAWFDKLDITNEALTYHGPSKGVTIEVAPFGSFAESSDRGLTLIVDPGFQFLCGAAVIVMRTVRPAQGGTSGAIIWQNEDTNYRQLLQVNGEAYPPVARTENNIVITPTGAFQVINGFNSHGGASISNNILIHRGVTPATNAAVSVGFTTRDLNIKNNIVFGFTHFIDTLRVNDFDANVTDGVPSDRSLAFVTPDTYVTSSPDDTFRAFVPNSNNPNDFDFRLRDSADNPAVGIAQYIDDPNTPQTDFYGNPRIENGFSAGVLEPVMAVAIEAVTLSVSPLGVAATVAAAVSVPGTERLTTAPLGLGIDLGTVNPFIGSVSAAVPALETQANVSPLTFNAQAVQNIDALSVQFLSGKALPIIGAVTSPVAALGASFTVEAVQPLLGVVTQPVTSLSVSFSVSGAAPIIGAASLDVSPLSVFTDVGIARPISIAAGTTILPVAPLGIAVTVATPAPIVGAVAHQSPGLSASFSINPALPAPAPVSVPARRVTIQALVQAPKLDIGAVTVGVDAVDGDLSGIAASAAPRPGFARLDVTALNIFANVAPPSINPEILIEFPPITSDAIAMTLEARPALNADINLKVSARFAITLQVNP